MKKYSGEITVFLSLVLVILVSLLFTVIEGVKVNTMRFQTECAADVAMQSALAEYNRELLEQYDLFFTETGYGSGEGGYILLEEHIKDYMQKNLEHPLMPLSADYAAVLKAAGAADEAGGVLEREAVRYMLDRYGFQDLSDLNDVFDQINEKGFLEDTLTRRRAENEKTISETDTTVEKEDGRKKRIAIENPADNVNRKRGSDSILSTVAKKNGISGKSVPLQTLLSHRNRMEHDGFFQNEKRITALEELVFQVYLMEKCGNYTKEKKNSALVYEMEYILAGGAGDRENLKTVVNRLLLLREAANFAYLMSDSAKQAEAEALAMTLSAVILFPELKDLIKLSILIAWAYAESVNDVRILLESGKVPLIKDAESWRIGLKSAMELKMEDGSSGEKGLDYEAYLHALLACMNRQERNERFMDVIEMDVRRTAGNEKFYLDHCLGAFTVEMTVSSGSGAVCQIIRTAEYRE